MPPHQNDKPSAGEEVEIYDFTTKEFKVGTIKKVLHQGMNGWTVEATKGLIFDVIPTEYTELAKPAWREWNGKR